MILRKIEEVEVKDIGKLAGLPENMITIQWIVSNEVGDKRYRHRFAVRKYTLAPLNPEIIPFHNHTYIQAMHILKGKLYVESPEGSLEAVPGDTVYFYENEPHKAAPIGDETVELLCIIDCPGDGGDCWASEKPKFVDCFTPNK